MHWKLYEGSLKWGFVIQKFSDSCNQYLNLTVGDFVFIVRHTAEWYYGFKSTDSSKFGAFPKVCVCIGKSEILSEVGAEMQMMFAELLLLYRNNAQNELAKVTPTISKIIELKESLSRKVTEHEMIEGLRGLLSWVSLGQRELSLPITLRDHSLKSINPYSKVPVDLVISHRKFLKHIGDPKSSAHWPATQLFSIRISFSRLPQAELTVFLASQQILRQNEHILFSPTSVADGLMLEHQNATEPNAIGMSHSATSTFQVAPKITRLTENVILNGYEQSSRDVVFTELDPFQPREERLLLMVLVNRMGPVQVKRPKSSNKASSRNGPALSSSAAQYRRPVGVACVDITRQVVPCLNRPSWMEPAVTSTKKQSPNGLSTAFNTYLPRVVTIVTTGEQFQTEALLNLAKQTPVSYFTVASGRDMMHSGTGLVQTGFATLNALIDSPAAQLPPPPQPPPPPNPAASTNTVSSNSLSSTSVFGPNLASDDLDFSITNMEVLTPLQSQIITCSSTGDQRVLCGRRFGFSKALSVEAESDRCDLFVTLVSGEFNKGAKKQEKNVEVEMSVRDSSGNLLNWQPGNRSARAVFNSTVYYHKNHPRWSELFTVALPSGSYGCGGKRQSVAMDGRRLVVSQLDERRSGGGGGAFADLHHTNEPGELACAHLRFVCRHRSGGTTSKDKLLGVAFLRLQPSTAIPVLLLDGCYQLLVHKMDAHQIESCAYLRETSFLPNGPTVSAGSGSSMGSSGSQSSLGTGGLLGSSTLASFGQSKQRHEILSVEIRLCSSHHTSDENLTKVLLWRKYQDDLVMCLPRGINLSQRYVELQKFTRSLIDSLLQILDTTLDQNGTSPRLNVSLGYSVLTALAKCYHDLLIKPAYQELITAYLNSTQFSYTTVHNPYLRLLNSILQDVLARSMPTATETVTVGTASASPATDTNGNPNKGNNGNREVPAAAGPGRIDDKAVEMIFSTIGWAFRMIVRSRQLELDRFPPDSLDVTESGTFMAQLDEFFAQLILITRLNNSSLSLKIVNAVSQIVKDVVLVYPHARLARSIVSLLDRMIDFPELPNRKILVETIESPLFECAESRRILMPSIQRSLTKFFADTLTKELVPNRTEDHLVMDLWCDALLTFTSRFVQVTKQSQSTPAARSDTEKRELYDSLVQTDFVRWTMQQLGRVFLFVHQQDSSARSSGALDDDDETARASLGSGFSPSMRFSAGSRPSSPTTKGRRSLSGERKPFAGLGPRQVTSAANRLQDVRGCLAGVLLTLLDQFDLPLWRMLLTPRTDFTSNTGSPPACPCSVCAGLSLVPVFDFVHELVSLFSMMHTYPVYPAPTRHSTATAHSSTPSSCQSDDSPRTCGATSPPTPGATRARSDPRRPIEFGGSWVEMLMAASTVELRVFRILIDVALAPLCSAKCVENKGLATLRRTISTSSPDAGRFSAEHSFVTELINLVQHSLGSFVVQQCHLCMEALPALLRTRVDQSLFGQAADMREVACELLTRLWNALNERSKSYYIPMILPTVIDMTTVPLAKIRENCVNLIFDALRISPNRVERVFVSEIDRVMQWAGTGFAADMHRLLGDRLHESSASSLDARRKGLITDLLRQIECLLNYGEFLNHSSKLSEMLALHNLRTLYESIGRKDMTLHYLYRLEGLHAECGNVIERGYTLEVISKQYTWSEEPVETSNIAPHYVRYGAISSRALRERLLLDSLECLKEATDFERAIEVCEQLAELYRTVSPNFPRLSQILREQAELYERIVSPTESRLSFRYYLLTLHGPGFARFLTERSNCLIYRTQAQLIELINELHQQFPQCTVLNKPPVESDELFDRPCIFPSGNVKPVPVIPEPLSARGIDAKIKSYYLHNRVECFTYLRPVKQNTGEKRERPQFEQIRHYVAEMMPGTMPIMPVIRTETKLLSPTELANDQVGEMIRHLENSLVKVTGRNGTLYMNDFVGTLTSSIDSPVSGGLPKLLESVELSDDAGQESSFATLSESVLELLELQMAGLETWYRLDPSPSPGVRLGDPNATGNFHLQSMVDSYETLVRDMSCKFGFAVDHLKASHLRYGPMTSATTTGLGASSSLAMSLTVERRLSSGTSTVRSTATGGMGTLTSSAQPTNSRVFHRFDSVINVDPTSTIRSERHRLNSRPLIDPSDVPPYALSPSTDASIASLLASEPPALPDRPNLRKASLSEYRNPTERRPDGDSQLKRPSLAELAPDSSTSGPLATSPPLSGSTYDRRTSRTTRPDPPSHRDNVMHTRPPIPNRHCASDRAAHNPVPEDNNNVDDDQLAPPIPERQRGSFGGGTVH